MSLHDLAVIGAGPAGLSAAAAAAESGLRVVLLDAADRPGGQYFRHAAGERTFALHRVDYRAGHRVWAVEKGFVVHALVGERESRPVRIEARALVIAAGAHDRSLPFPGWDLPGVMTAGGAQALLKGNRVALGRRVVVAGTGPFLLPVATGLAEAGVEVAGVYEANRAGGRRRTSVRGGGGPVDVTPAARQVGVPLTRPWRGRGHPDRELGAGGSARVSAGRSGGLADGSGRRGVRSLAGAAGAAGSAGLAGWSWASAANVGKLVEAAGYGAALIRQRIPYRWGHAVIAAHGTDSVEAVSVARLDRDWRPVPGSERVVECDALAVGYGFTPQLELPLQLGCATRLDADGSQVVAVDAAQRTSVPGVYAAGETTGVGGVQAALVEGELAGLAAAGATASAAGRRLRELLVRRRRAREFAGLLHAMFPVRDGWVSWIEDDTLVCRCEEVPYRAVQSAVELGAEDARAVKLLSRAGMGWCQGRVCGFATACLVSGAPPPGHDRVGGALTPWSTGVAPDTARSGARPIAQPIRLGTLAGIDQEEAASSE